MVAVPCLLLVVAGWASVEALQVWDRVVALEVLEESCCWMTMLLLPRMLLQPDSWLPSLPIVEVVAFLGGMAGRCGKGCGQLPLQQPTSGVVEAHGEEVLVILEEEADGLEEGMEGTGESWPVAASWPGCAGVGCRGEAWTAQDHLPRRRQRQPSWWPRAAPAAVAAAAGSCPCSS